MNYNRILIFLAFCCLFSKSYTQGFSISKPRLEFSGTHLNISYDIISDKQSDKFFVWVEIRKANGERIKAESLSGAIGETGPGKEKEILWFPGGDAILLDEEISVEVLAEKYVLTCKKGSAFLMSVAVPGLGQAKISGGKPYWLTSLGAYGSLGGGLVLNSSYKKTYDLYLAEEDPAIRAELLDQAQKESNISTGLLISAAAIWAVNLVWVSAMPRNYKPLQHVNFSLNNTTGFYCRQTSLTLKVEF